MLAIGIPQTLAGAGAKRFSPKRGGHLRFVFL